jgi:hypothetical protein
VQPHRRTPYTGVRDCTNFLYIYGLYAKGVEVRMPHRRTTLWATQAGLVVVVSSLFVGLGATSAFHGSGTSAAAPTGATSAVIGPNYTVTFTETGLAVGQNWSVTLCITSWWCEDDDGALYVDTNNTSLTFSVPNGTYYFHVRAFNDTRATPAFGSVNVSGAAPSPIAIRFGNPATYNVAFVETGLAPGTTWQVILDVGWWSSFFGAGCDQCDTHVRGITQDGNWGDGGNSGDGVSNTTTVNFSLPNGTYNYSVANVSNYSIVGAANGTFNVSGGSPAPIKVAFAAVPTYTVTFVESGLPNGTNWSVGVRGSGSFGDQGDQNRAEDDAGDVGSSQETANTSMSFYLPNGSYHYRVGEVDGYLANASFGYFNVTGTTITIDVNFTALPEYNVSFNESGLPNGTDWGLRLVGNTGPLVGHGHAQVIKRIGATRGLVTFQVPDGKYHYKLIALKGWKASGGFTGKTFHVTGSSVTGSFVFAPKSAPRLAPASPATGIQAAGLLAQGVFATLRASLASVRIG